MEITDAASLVATLSTIVSGFAILTRTIYKASFRFLDQMAKNHLDLIRPIIEDVKQSAAIASRLSDLEQEHRDIVKEQSNISTKLDAMSNRIDETYSLLLKHMKP